MGQSSRLVSRDNSATEVYVPLPRGGDWGVLADVYRARISKTNVLLVGPEHLVVNLLGLLAPDLEPQAMIRRENGRLLLHTDSPRVRAAVIRDLDTLTREEQRRLLDWLEAAPTRTQVISTTSAPLLPLVKTGAFSDKLYYRLNTMYVDLY